MNKYLDGVKKFENPTWSPMYSFVVYDEKNEEGVNYYFIPNKSAREEICGIYNKSVNFMNLAVSDDLLKGKKYTNYFYLKALDIAAGSLELYIEVVEEMVKKGDIIVDNEKDWAEIMAYVSAVSSKVNQSL